MGEYDIRNELDALDRAFGTGSSASLGSFGSFEMPLTPYTGLDDESPKVPTVADIEMGGTPNSFKNLPELPKREHGIVNSERPCFVSPAEPAPEPIADIHAPPDKSNKFKPLLIATSKRFLSPTAKVSPDEAPLPTLELLDTLQRCEQLLVFEQRPNTVQFSFLFQYCDSGTLRDTAEFEKAAPQER